MKHMEEFVVAECRNQRLVDAGVVPGAKIRYFSKDIIILNNSSKIACPRSEEDIIVSECDA